MVVSTVEIQDGASSQAHISLVPSVEHELGIARSGAQSLNIPETPLFGTDGIRGRVGE